MLDLVDKQAERAEAAAAEFMALAFNMNNGTIDGQTATSGSNKGIGGENISACLDSKRQKIVPLGDYYYTDSCTLCLCSQTEFLCKQISCAPPEKCDGYIKKDPLHCCDVCVPAVVVERPNDQSSLNMKLGALTVALFLVISLVLFTLHRMRRKRLLVTLRRLQSFRYHGSTCSHGRDGSSEYRNSIDAVENGLFPNALPQLLTASERAAVLAVGPPPYNAAVTLPRAPESLARAPPRAMAPAEPPPTYRQAVQEVSSTIRRCASQNGHHHRPSSVILAGHGRHSRTSDYPDDDEADVRSTSTCSSSSLSSSSTASSLSSSRASLNIVDEEEPRTGDEDDCCSCSQCDSGLSEERGSLSSNEVRPRSEILLTNSASYQTSLGQASSNQLLQATTTQQQSSENGAAANPQRSRSAAIGAMAADDEAEPSTSSGRARETTGKLCKKKLKKLIIKAKRKAKRGKRNVDERGGANSTISATATAATTNCASTEGESSRRTINRRPAQTIQRRRSSDESEPGPAEAMSVTSV